ncbi:MAG: hypothetical protein MUF21_10450 [Gemmatimonadaceae bacterium]|jgi:hypothetical protein|nr:hypothetical protein [Gemmatimonadaceae bacterium]
MRGLAAVGAGLAALFALAFGFEAAIGALIPTSMDAQGRVSSPAVLGLLLAAGVVSGAIAGWLTARLAVSRHMGHALFLASIAVAVVMFISILNWDRAPGAYHLASWVLLPLACVAGASVRVQALRAQFGVAFDDDPWTVTDGA